MLVLWRKIPLTYKFSESLTVEEYNHIFEISKTLLSVLQQFCATSIYSSLSFSFIGLHVASWVPSTILLGYLVTHGHHHQVSVGAKNLVRHWTCGFHNICASSASSKTKLGKKFPYVFVLMLAMKEPLRTVHMHNWNITLQFSLLMATGSEF